MTSRFSELAVDCHDPHRLADFWCAVLGYKVVYDKDNVVAIGSWGWSDPDEAKTRLRAAPVPPHIVFVPVPEDKTVKNRIHIDVSPYDTTQEEEVQRLLALGATHADVGQGEVHWVVM